MILLVTGSRTWQDETRIQRVMGTLRFTHPDLVVRHGANSQGTDAMVSRWCAENNVPEDRMPSVLGGWSDKSAARNLEMITKEPVPGLCVAFIRNQSLGATGCVNLAKKHGIVTIVFEDEDFPVLDSEG